MIDLNRYGPQEEQVEELEAGMVEAARTGVIATEHLPQGVDPEDPNAASAGPVTIDRAMLREHEEMVFGGLSGFIPWRSFAEKGSNPVPPQTVWSQIGGPYNTPFRERHAAGCATRGAACYVVPGVVAEDGQAKAADITHCQIIVVDLDQGDIAAKLAHGSQHLPRPTMIVKSGGVTAEGQDKLHLYWRLAQPATGGDLDLVSRLRRLLAVRLGGDTSVASLHQPIRLPGSIHCKGGHRKLVERVSYTPDARYDLFTLAAQAEAMPPVGGAAPSNVIDLNTAGKQKTDLVRALAQPTHEGAVDDITRFDAFNAACGHYIRLAHQGHLTTDQALEQTRAWNIANLRPAWDDARITTEFGRLWDKHVRENGQAKLVSSFADDEDFDASTMTDDPPPVQWVVENFIPRGCAGTLSAAGGAGKGLLTLDLGLKITTGRLQHGPLDLNRPVSWFGNTVIARGNVYIVSGEDRENTIKRRLNKLDPQKVRAKSKFKITGHAYADKGGAKALFDRTGGGTAEFEALKCKLRRMTNLALIIIDPITPFVELALDVDNVAVGRMMGQLSALSAELDATILVCHHMNKGKGLANATSLAAARECIRGAGAVVDNGRFAIVLWEQSSVKQKEDLKRLGRTFKSESVYKAGLCKSNEQGDKNLHTLVRDEFSGLLIDESDALRVTAGQRSEDDKAFAHVIGLLAAEDQPFTKTRDKGVYVRKDLFPPQLRAAKHKMEDRVEDLIEAGLIVREEKTGYLDIPGGKWAAGRKTSGDFAPGASRAWEKREEEAAKASAKAG